MDALARNNVTITGTGTQAIVLVHGFGCDQHMWRFITPAFVDRYRVVLLDLVGAGQSDLEAYDPAHYSTLEAHAEDVLEVLNALNLYDVVLVGHSVSGTIGMLAAIRAPERVAKLVLVAPSPRFLNDVGYTGGFEQADIDELLETMDNNYLGWSAALTPVIMGQPAESALTGELHQSFCRTTPAIAQHFARVTFLADNRADLPRVHTPCLIIQCAHDALAPVAVGNYLHQQLAGSELVLLPTTGHCPHLSEPRGTIAAIEAFLKQDRSPA
ncbi:alpha/beta hydrolase [Hymenobacter glaciei]|uniref:Alpha/beta hydrolase n=1 Tax=Hymenobacter glaciei TaxID=877209 RepID=A0ABP7UM73_9BACT